MGITCGCVPLKSINSHNQILSQPLEKDNKEIDFLTYDYHEHSRLSWVCINDIRTNPEKYSKLIAESLALLTQQSQEQKELNPLQTFLDNFLKSNEEMLSIIKELGTKIDSIAANKKPSIEWNEDLYKALLEETKIVAEDSSKTLQPSVIFSLATKKNLRVVEYELNGYYDPEITAWKLLLEHKEKTNDILSDDYIYAIAFSSCEDGKKENFITKFYFMFEININDVIINGVNPITGNYQPLTLNESFMKDVEYKQNIVGGSYVYTGEEVNVVFKLCDGTKKEENFKSDKGIL